MRLINFGIKPQVLPSRVYKPDVLPPSSPAQDKVRPEVWKRNAQHLINAAKNAKGVIAPIGGTHIDFSRPLSVHMNDDYVKKKIKESTLHVKPSR